MFQLRCDRCGSALDQPAAKPMQLVVLVKAGVGPKIPPMAEEQRRRCRGCGFVNIFLPLRESELAGRI
jgi:hypothetical protein